jgi:hypothetical protein
MAQALAMGVDCFERVGFPFGKIPPPLQAVLCCGVLLVLLVFLPKTRGEVRCCCCCCCGVLLVLLLLVRGGSAVAEVVLRRRVFLVLLVSLHTDEVAAAFIRAASRVPVLVPEEDGLEGVRGRDRRPGGLVPSHVLLLLLLDLGGFLGRCCR